MSEKIEIPVNVSVDLKDGTALLDRMPELKALADTDEKLKAVLDDLDSEESTGVKAVEKLAAATVVALAKMNGPNPPDPAVVIMMIAGCLAAANVLTATMSGLDESKRKIMTQLAAYAAAKGSMALIKDANEHAATMEADLMAAVFGSGGKPPKATA